MVKTRNRVVSLRKEFDETTEFMEYSHEQYEITRILREPLEHFHV